MHPGASLLESGYSSARADRIPRGFKWAYLAFVLVLVPIYAAVHGWFNFLWFSNVALLGGLLAAWLESRRLASMMLVAVVLLELGWVLDFLLSMLVWGWAPLGIVHYMFNPEIPLFVRLLSLYHLPLPFVLIWLVWRLGYDPRAWRYMAILGWAILLLTFALADPENNVNWVLGPGGQVQEWMHPVTWLGVVMAFCTGVWWLTHLLFGWLLPRRGVE